MTPGIVASEEDELADDFLSGVWTRRRLPTARRRIAPTG
jgi:hypothetical protein